MTRLPVVAGRSLVRALEKVGYVQDRQKGSHIVLRHTAPPYRRVTVPDHKEIAKGPAASRTYAVHASGLTAVSSVARLRSGTVWPLSGRTSAVY